MDSMKMQIDELVEQLSPQPGSFGMLSTQDVRELVRRAAVQGTLIGWVAGERLAMTRANNQMQEHQHNYNNLAQHCKDLEMEIMGMKR
jgi:hypothetical protein